MLSEDAINIAEIGTHIGDDTQIRARVLYYLFNDFVVPSARARLCIFSFAGRISFRRDEQLTEWQWLPA